jgi:hypothetical protein
MWSNLAAPYNSHFPKEFDHLGGKIGNRWLEHYDALRWTPGDQAARRTIGVTLHLSVEHAFEGRFHHRPHQAVEVFECVTCVANSLANFSIWLLKIASIAGISINEEGWE